MAYVSPTIAASGLDYAALKSTGAHGYIAAAVAAQSAETAAQVELVGKLLHKVQSPQVIGRLKDIIDSYLHGDPVAIATIDAELVDLCFAFKSVAVAIDEIGALVDANPGTLAYTTGDAINPRYKRALA